MNENVIFVFSGTGNSLWVAKEIAKELANCRIITMGSNNNQSLSKDCHSIGFVYPTYIGGVPRAVKECILHTDFKGNENAYFYGISTCGKISRAENAIAQLGHLLKTKKITLNYGEYIPMFSNYVIRYELSNTAKEDARKASIVIKPIIENIKNHCHTEIESLTFRHFRWIAFMSLIAPRLDKNFNVSDACVKCGICEKVCPVNNIIINEDPKFMHHCEHCLSCLQSCPTKAINYKNITQTRKRYLHPDISWKDLAKLHNKL